MQFTYDENLVLVADTIQEEICEMLKLGRCENTKRVGGMQHVLEELGKDPFLHNLIPGGCLLPEIRGII